MAAKRTKPNGMKLVVPPTAPRKGVLPNVAPGEEIEPAGDEPLKKPRKLVTAETPANEGGPDWNMGTSYGGGEKNSIWNIPQPWIMRYPNKAGDRQRVKIDLSSWRGISMGASHYYARVELEQNAVWDSRELTWRIDDHAEVCKPCFFRAHVFSRKEGVDFIELVVQKFFGDDKRYRLEYMYTESEKWPAIREALLNDTQDV